MSRPSRGPALALGSAILFGASTPFAKLLLGEISPWAVAGLLYIGAGIGLTACWIFQAARGRDQAHIARSDYPALLGAVLSGGIVAPVLLMLGLAAVRASTAALLLNLEGLFTLAIAWLLLRENVDWRIGAGAAAILLGAAILSWPAGASSTPEHGGTAGWVGSLAIAGACLAWAIDNNLTRQLSSANPVQISAVKDLVAGAVNVGLAWALGAQFASSTAAVSAAAVGFVGYGVSLVMFILALRDLGTARTAAYFTLAPFIGSGVAIALLGEPFSWRLGVAAALMALGLWPHLSEQHRHEHEHLPMAHEHTHVHDEHHQHTHDPADPPQEPHSHVHAHPRLAHSHVHFPDIHHRHEH